MKLEESQFRFEWFSGTGKGGQHRNKHQNCCRCIHIPTGIKANGTNSRSREDNKRNSLAVCKARIFDAFSTDTERNRAGSERIRTYHEPDNRVIDHKSGLLDSYKNVVINNNLAPMIDARRMAANL